MSKDSYGATLVFSAGPVQSFVGQARRTRDLWAGSWLLSYLSESALAAAEGIGGTAILPFRERTTAGTVSSLGKSIGGYPNRFEMGFASLDQAAEGGRAAVLAFKGAWLGLSEKVWNAFIDGPAGQFGLATREIWDRQLQNYWELSWVTADTKSKAGHQAAARKTFRNIPATNEPGFKCSLMGTHQELSGHYGRGCRPKQRKFWNAIRDQSATLDLLDNEHLCAIALVKRLFPRVLDQLRENVPWPSTSFIAALPWLKRLRNEHLTLAQGYVNYVRELRVDRSERDSAKEAGIGWADVDAQVWFKGGLRRNEWKIEELNFRTLIQRFSELRDDRQSRPLPFYGLLVMDGDSLGKLLGRLPSPTDLSQRLELFATSVQEIVKRHNGRTIYAGGDDVLAMVAAENALDAAIELSRKYQECFEGTDAAGFATLSGALLYAPLHTPFQQLIRQGHDILDTVAKDKTGRNSLVIDIVLGSGLGARWSAPWPVLLGEFGGNPALTQVLDRFQTAIERDAEGKPVYNASYLYNLRQQFCRLFPGLSPQPGDFVEVDFGEQGSDILTDVAHAEYRRRLSKEQSKLLTPADTRSQVEDLLWLSRRWYRKPSAGGRDYEICCDPKCFTFDGWRVARFLQQVKEGNLGDHCEIV